MGASTLHGRRLADVHRRALRPGNRVATADVTLERGGRTGGFLIHERYFGRDEIAAALLAAGFAIEAEANWSPFPIGGLGKTWWAARLG